MDLSSIRWTPGEHRQLAGPEGRIPTEIVKARSKILTDLCHLISKEKNREHIGKQYEVLITEKGKNNKCHDYQSDCFHIFLPPVSLRLLNLFTKIPYPFLSNVYGDIMAEY